MKNEVNITDYWEEECTEFPPFIAVGNGELHERLGKTAECPKCGKVCEVEHSKPPTLSFVKCCEATYLVGINGKRWRGRKI